MAARGEERVDIEKVIQYGKDLRDMIEETGLPERKAFLRSLIKRIETDGKQVKVAYTLPLPSIKF